MAIPSKEYRDLYNAGIAAVRAKDLERARKLFLAAVTLDEQQKSGWLALARLETDLAQKADYYRRVLKIDPRDAVARAFVDGMRHTRPQRWGISLLGLLMLLLGGTLALLVTQSENSSDNVLPTTARLPSLTPSAAIELAAPNSAELIISQETGDDVTPTPSPEIQIQATIFSLELPTLESTTTPLPAPQAQLVFPTATIAEAAPTTVFNPPVPTVPTAAPGIIVTVAPSATNPSAATATAQPLFMDITEPPPTNLPVFATPTLDYQGDFNTEVPPPDQTFPEDPNSGGVR